MRAGSQGVKIMSEHLEVTLKHFNPKSMQISDSVRATSSNQLTGTDYMAAIGMTAADAEFGLSLFYAKSGVSEKDRERAIGLLTKYAHKQAPKHVGKAAGRNMAICMSILATAAYADYARSASDEDGCEICNASGFISVQRDVVKHEGITNAAGEVIVEPSVKHECVKEKCTNCGGKGKLSSRCRCNGTGKVLSKVKRSDGWLAEEKDCDRCSGRGYSRVKPASVYRIISKRLPELQERTWNRNWKPFYELLVSKCYAEESNAHAAFKKITS